MYVSMAASSKLLAVSITYPYQVVRARLQVLLNPLVTMMSIRVFSQDQDVRYRGVNDIIMKIIR